MHDDNWNAEFFLVYRAGRGKKICSAYMSANRNDSTFIRGNCLIYKDRIEFTECYYNIKNTISIDSIKKIFYPNKCGDLRIKEFIEYKNGKRIERKYD